VEDDDMTLQITAYGAGSAGASLERMTIQRRDVGEHDVLIDIRYVGICHSDVHQARGEWGNRIFPMVPGHEITGVVQAVGSQVTRHSVGDRVGVGCFVDSCRNCVNCRAGEEQHCVNGAVDTYNGRFYDGEPTYGGYSTHIVVDEHYVLRIPDALSFEGAAPLLCAGTTNYVPLARWGAGPGKAVAIVGIGGLGHVGVKIASAMGADVTALSRTEKPDSLRLGASQYFATADAGTLDNLANSFDIIVNTVSAAVDLTAYLRLLRHSGVLVLAGIPSEPASFDTDTLLMNQRSLAGTLNGSIQQTQEMLDFCALHGIEADVEVISAAEINAAYDRLVNADVRYRFVIDASTIDSP
jgi:uncharacterized zinc-type alcohol dehydrogenase-like protein